MRRTPSVVVAVLFFLFFLASCSFREEEGLEMSYRSPILLIDSKQIDEEDAFFVDGGSVFLSVKSIQDVLKDKGVRFEAGGIRTKLKVSDYLEDESLKRAFHRDEISFLIPTLNYRSKDYINVRFLRELFDMKVIEADKLLLVFTKDAPLAPNKKALLPKSTELYAKTDAGFELIEKTASASEVYVADREGEEGKVPIYHDGNGLCYADRSSLEALSEYRNEPKKIRAAQKKEKYKALQMNWEVLTSYQESIVRAPKRKMEGLDILIPTCFELGEAELSSKLSHEYVDGAKDLGYLVYGHFADKGDLALFRSLLAEEGKRKELSDSLLFYCAYYGLDGINFDLTEAERSDREAFTRFFSDTSKRARMLGLTLSICVPPMDGSSVERRLFHKAPGSAVPPGADVLELGEGAGQAILEGVLDLPAIKDDADFFILMAIDQYGSESQVPGPVSSLAWTEENIRQILSVIPAERLVLAQASYLRIYALDAGDLSVRGTQLSSLKDFQEITKTKHVKLLYDYSASQEVAEYPDAEKKLLYRVWLEDEDSFSKRLELIQKYRLKGLAIWSLAFEEGWQVRLKNSLLQEGR